MNETHAEIVMPNGEKIPATINDSTGLLVKHPELAKYFSTYIAESLGKTITAITVAAISEIVIKIVKAQTEVEIKQHRARAEAEVKRIQAEVIFNALYGELEKDKSLSTEIKAELVREMAQSFYVPPRKKINPVKALWSNYGVDVLVNIIAALLTALVSAGITSFGSSFLFLTKIPPVYIILVITILVLGVVLAVGKAIYNQQNQRRKNTIKKLKELESGLFSELESDISGLLG